MSLSICRFYYRPLLFKQGLSLFLGAVCMLTVVFSVQLVVPLSVQAQVNIPHQVNPGLIQSQELQYLDFRRSKMYLGQPITKKDVTPQKTDEPLIQFLNLDIQGAVVRSDKSGQDAPPIVIEEKHPATPSDSEAPGSLTVPATDTPDTP